MLKAPSSITSDYNICVHYFHISNFSLTILVLSMLSVVLIMAYTDTPKGETTVIYFLKK